MKKKPSIAIVFFAFTLPFSAKADNLVTIYKQALASDAIFKAAENEWLAARENLPISKSALLPNVNFSGQLGRQYNKIDGIDQSSITTGSRNFYDKTASYGLNLTQPIFNYASWASVQNASYSVKEAHAKYLAAAQDLIARTVTAYFNVLQAQDVLRVTRAEKKSVATQLNNDKQRYNVGLIPITNVHESQARFDTVLSQEITAENDLSNKIEALREIIGKQPGNLDPLAPNPPLISPQPTNINHWMTATEKQNFSLLAARYATLAARSNIDIKSGGHLPTLDAAGSYKYDYSNNVGGTDIFSRSKVASLGLNLNFPIWQGGLVNAEVRQANDLYQQAYSLQTVAYRQAIGETRRSFLGVIDAINKIKADRQSIVSNNSAYNSMLASYKYGTRTITDVLLAETNLYTAQKNYANDQYYYIGQTIALKKSAGILGLSDIVAINGWLKANNKAIYAREPLKSHHTVKKQSYPKKFQYNLAKEKPGTKKPSLNLSSQRYMIQLAALNTEKEAKTFIRKYASLADMHYFYVNQDGKAWYKVYSGTYASLSQAKDAKNRLTQVLPQSIWIRKASHLQKEGL